MIKRVLILALAAALTVPVFTQDEASMSVVKKFKTMYPKTILKEIRKSQISGLYEVVMGENITYIDESGRYFIFRHLSDMQQQVDLTAQRRFDSKKTEFPAQRPDQAIKTIKGNGSRTLAMFNDPDHLCCKQLEGKLVRLGNVTIYTFLYSLESLHPEARTKTVSVWCASNKAEAWNELILAGKKSKLMACNNPVNDNLVLGSKLGVVGIPTLIAADGRVLPGSVPAEKVDQRLNAGRPSAPTAAWEVTQ